MLFLSREFHWIIHSSFFRVSFAYGCLDSTAIRRKSGVAQIVPSSSNYFLEEMRRLHLKKILFFDKELCLAGQRFFSVSEKVCTFKVSHKRFKKTFCVDIQIVFKVPLLLG